MSPDDFRRLVSAGLSTDQIAVVMEMMAAKEAAFAEVEEARKAKGRERVAKWRADRNVTDTSPKVSEPLTRDRVAPVSDKPKPIDTTTSQNTTSKDHSEFRGELASLDADRLTTFIKLRKSKKASITGYAAKLFLKDVAECGITLGEAVDLCIGRNWTTVKPEYLKGRQARGSPPQQPSLADALAAVATEAENRNDPRHSTSDESPRGSISYLPRVQIG